jgi:hypothetical protein
MTASQFWSLSRFQLPKQACPQFAGFPQEIGQTHVRHTSILAAAYRLELRDDVLEAERLSRSLCLASFKHDVHDVDMEVVIRWLVFFYRRQLVRSTSIIF